MNWIAVHSSLGSSICRVWSSVLYSIELKLLVVGTELLADVIWYQTMAFWLWKSHCHSHCGPPVWKPVCYRRWCFCYVFSARLCVDLLQSSWLWSGCHPHLLHPCPSAVPFFAICTLMLLLWVPMDLTLSNRAVWFQKENFMSCSTTST